jgi:hypothetical protein
MFPTGYLPRFCLRVCVTALWQQAQAERHRVVPHLGGQPTLRVVAGLQLVEPTVALHPRDATHGDRVLETVGGRRCPGDPTIPAANRDVPIQSLNGAPQTTGNRYRSRPDPAPECAMLTVQQRFVWRGTGVLVAMLLSTGEVTEARDPTADLNCQLMRLAIRRRPR